MEFVHKIQAIEDRTVMLFVIIALAFVMLISVSDFIRKCNVRKDLIKARKSKAKGIIFGKEKSVYVYSPTSQEGHVAVFGGSGLGKTSAILIPTLRSWSGTSFTIDISGDICKNVEMPNKAIYEPSNVDSVPYNIFGLIDLMDDEADKNEALEQLAIHLMPDSENMSDTTRFFQTEGRKILTASLIAFYHTGEDFIDICERITQNSWKSLFQAIDETGYTKAIQFINSFEGASEQNTAGCKQACDMAVKLFSTNLKIKRNVRRPQENEECIMPSSAEKSNVFVVVEDSKLKLYAPLLHILTVQCLEHFSQRNGQNLHTILLCLDEFASLGHMEITDALRKLRKKKVRIMLLTQSLADIDLVYGCEERKAMMNNFKFKVVLGASDTDTQEYFAKLIGYQKMKKHSVSTNSRQTTRTESEAKEWAIEPAELDRLGNELVVLYPGGYMKIQKNYYYK